MNGPCAAIQSASRRGERSGLGQNVLQRRHEAYRNAVQMAGRRSFPVFRWSVLTTARPIGCA